MSFFAAPSYNNIITTWPPEPERLQSRYITLHVRQQPRQALVTSPKKEKSRKPVDPPVVVQMQVAQHADNTQMFLHSPYLFAVANLEYENGHGVVPRGLIGTTTSSLHRLKDIDERGQYGVDVLDGAFFVFPDLSVTVLGRYRLRFTLFHLDKAAEEVSSLQETISDVFEVVSHKDYLGLDESTDLTKCFVDQGVRLRLRKEVRCVGIPRSSRATMSVQTPSDLELPKLDESPDEQRSKRPATDDSPGPAKQARTDFGPMYPGVNRNTRGWGAFSRNDMKAFCTAEKHPSTTSTSPLVLDFKLSSIATSYSYPAPGQYAESTPPSLPSVAPRMAVAPTPSYWQQQQQYQPTTAFQSSPTPARHTPSQISQRLFQQAATTPPSPPYTIQQTRQFQFGTELSRSSFSSTSNRSSAPTYSNASAYNDSQSYSNSPVQGPYGAHVSRGAGALEIEGQQEDAVLALQTLASASEQRPYLALASINSGDVGGTLSHMPATTGMSSQPSMAAAHQNNYHLPQATQAYQPRDTGGMSFEQVSAREPLQQQGFTGGSSSLNWGIGFPLVSTGGDADRKPYGHMG